MNELVSVVVVTYDSEKVITDCLASIVRQTYPALETLVIDNASTDGTEAAILRSGAPMELIKNPTNRGFAAAHNQGIRLTRGDFYLALNPDVVMSESFIEELVKGMALEPRIGAVTGKLLRPRSGEGPRIIDTTGIYMTPSARHLDRGSGEADEGQYERPQLVFGVSGAAALYRRTMLLDVAIDGECFDEDFFVYREDADLAWRAQLFGWRALYTPRAIATHVRRVVPERRASLPTEINMHSVKNRFLMRLKNPSVREWLSLPLALARDLQVIGYVLLVERSSIPGLVFVARNLPRVLRKRRRIAERRKTSAREMLRWFRAEPVAFELS